MGKKTENGQALRNRIVGEGMEAPADLLANPANWRRHPREQLAALEGMLEAVGWVQRVIVNRTTGRMVDGHARVELAIKRGESAVPVLFVELTPDEERVVLAGLDPIGGLAATDQALLDALLEGVESGSADLDAFLESLRGQDDDGAGGGSGGDAPPAGSLADRFLIPPFSVLNAREGWWQDRKRAWLALGIRSEIGRGGGSGTPPHPPTVTRNANGTLNYGGTEGQAERFDRQRQRKADALAFGQDLMRGEHVVGAASSPAGLTFGKIDMDGPPANGTSIFDPVLCEIAYRWFCPPGGLVLDPFAGGSVRGIVASRLGRAYVGHELRAEQVEANRQQAAEICAVDQIPPRWIIGDSRRINETCADVDADLIFSCPPYADLEVYSDDPADLSTMAYADFRRVYFEIIAKACARLRPDSFACFVVGEVRDRRGAYLDFVGDTVQAFRDAGLAYYNEAILLTAIGSLPIRVGKQFSASRKLGKTHQNVLVFVKGDGKGAADRCGAVEIDTGALEAAATAGGDDQAGADPAAEFGRVL